MSKVADLFRRPSVLIETPGTIILMTCHYLDLGSAVEANFSSGTIKIRGTTQIWVVTRHQYGISELASQTSFRGETRGDVAKCRLFSEDLVHSQGCFIHAFSKLSDKTAWRNVCDISLPR